MLSFLLKSLKFYFHLKRFLLRKSRDKPDGVGVGFDIYPQFTLSVTLTPDFCRKGALGRALTRDTPLTPPLSVFFSSLAALAALAAGAGLRHHVLQLAVLHLLLVHHQHAHGHVLVRHTGRRRDVPHAQVVDGGLDDGVVRGVVAVVEHPGTVPLAEARVVNGRGDEVVTPSQLVEGQAEGVQLAAVFWRAGFVFVVGDFRQDGGGGRGGGKRQRGGRRRVFQSVKRRIFGL